MSSLDQIPPPHEFDERENLVVSGVAQACWAAATAQILAALIDARGPHGDAARAAFDVAFGVLFAVAAIHFRKVVTTKGNDVPLLFGALRATSAILWIRVIMTAGLLILFGLVIVVAFGAGVVRSITQH